MADLKYRISGSKEFMVPIVEQDDPSTGSSSKVPEWLVKIDELTTSTFANFTKYCELHGWYGEATSKSLVPGVGFINPAATLKHSELVIIIPVFSFLTDLENKMNAGFPIGEIEIVHVAGAQQKQSIKFLMCYIRGIQQELDRVVLKVNVSMKIDTITVYNLAGLPSGQTVSSMSYTTGIVGG